MVLVTCYLLLVTLVQLEEVAQGGDVALAAVLAQARDGGVQQAFDQRAAHRLDAAPVRRVHVAEAGGGGGGLGAGRGLGAGGGGGGRGGGRREVRLRRRLQVVDVEEVDAGHLAGGRLHVARHGDVDDDQLALRPRAHGRGDLLPADGRRRRRRRGDDDVGLSQGTWKVGEGHHDAAEVARDLIRQAGATRRDQQPAE